MSANRHEITDDGAQIRIKSPDGSLSTIIGTPRSTHIEDAVIGAIRQQARDIAELRADLKVAIGERNRNAIQREELRTDLAAAVTRAEQAEARLAAIEAAPTVAWQWMDTGHFRKNKPDGALVFDWRPLIARPAKD